MKSNPAAVYGQTATTVPTTITIPTIHAKNRQRDEGAPLSGNSKAKNKKRPMCETHNQEETQASASPPGKLLSGVPGSASSVTMAYSATKRRIPASRPMVQKSQPTGL